MEENGASCPWRVREGRGAEWGQNLELINCSSNAVIDKSIKRHQDALLKPACEKRRLTVTHGTQP